MSKEQRVSSSIHGLLPMEVVTSRKRQIRKLLLTLLISRGVRRAEIK